MYQNTKPIFQVEAEKRMPEIAIDWNREGAYDTWLNAYNQWMSLFYVEAREIARPLQANGKRPRKEHTLTTEEWDAVAERVSQIIAERHQEG